MLTLELTGMSQKKKTINISEEHHQALGALREKKSETFDQVIGRLLDSYSGSSSEAEKSAPSAEPMLSKRCEKALAELKAGNETLEDVVTRLLDSHQKDKAESSKQTQSDPDAIAAHLKSCGCGEALIGKTAEEAAKAWASSEFEAFEVKSWLDARCFDPSAAARLKDEGVSPVGAAVYTYRGGYTDTVGYKFAKGDMELVEVKQVVSCHF